VATILIISSIVKHLFWRASRLAGGADFIRGRGAGPRALPPTGAGVGYNMLNPNLVITYHKHWLTWQHCTLPHVTTTKEHQAMMHQSHDWRPAKYRCVQNLLLVLACEHIPFQRVFYLPVNCNSKIIHGVQYSRFNITQT